MKTALTLLVLSLGLSAQADYMLWCVDETPSDAAVSFAYARVVVQGEGVTEGTYLTVAGTDGLTEVVASSFPENGYSTEQVYSNLGDYNSAGYSFAVELYGLEDEMVGKSAYVSYADMLSNFAVYSNMSQTGVTPYVYGAFTATPEPTSGLLMLLGLGMLALRRKRICALMVLMALGTGAFAAQNDMLLSFATPGRDAYADGSTVLDGECYALVWTPDGATFGGLTAEAKPVSAADRLVLVAPRAKNGRCPMTVLEIDASAASAYAGGTFGLYLLDTRVRAADGSVTLAPFANGVPQAVNALGLAAVAGASDTLQASAPVALGSVGVYTEVTAPVITAIRIANATVELKVDGMSPVADYFVVPGGRPSEFAPALEVKPVDGTFTFPMPEGAAFFKVIGARKF